MTTPLPKLIAVLGPTASGKSSLGIALAQHFSGEIISADSRQVYTGMDIGTAKDPVEARQGIPHFGLDLIEPSETYTLADFQKYAYGVIDDMHTRDVLPVMVGGSSLYVSAVVDGYELPDAVPDERVREELEKMSLEELVAKAQEVDSEIVADLGDHNKRFLIRAIEIAHQTQDGTQAHKTAEAKYDVLKLGIDIDREVLYERINTRVDAMMQMGLVEETKRLRAQYDADLPSMSSIGYAEVGAMLDGEMTEEDVIAKIKQRTRHYAKRQLTWWRKDSDIVWVKNHEEAIAAVEKFL